MKSFFIGLLLLSTNYLFSQIELKNPEKLFNGVNYISSQTPVKNQGLRNTCSAFGVAAALEVMPGMPQDISEKYLYAVQKAKEYSNKTPIELGTYLKEYISTLNSYGILTEAQLPYPKEAPLKWYETDHELRKVMIEGDVGPVSLLLNYEPKALKIFISEYEYLDRNNSKNVTRIKRMLDAGVKAIPVSYELYTPAWRKFQSSQYTTITPDPGYGILLQDKTYGKYSDLKKRFPEINTKINSREFTFARTDKRTDIKVYSSHVVTIVGYDSVGFIIKNSWGTDWRFQGYERVSYDFHELFAYEALIFKKVSFQR